MPTFTESIIEQAALDWLRELGYAYAFGPELACDGARPERADYRQPLLPGRLQAALARLNPGLPKAALSAALRRVLRPGLWSPDAGSGWPAPARPSVTACTAPLAGRAMTGLWPTPHTRRLVQMHCGPYAPSVPH